MPPRRCGAYHARRAEHRFVTRCSRSGDERFPRQDADGRLDPDGLRQFIVGTGGATFHAPGTRQPNSELYQPSTLGLLKLELRADDFSWHFIAASGYSFTDRGWESCR